MILKDDKKYRAEDLQRIEGRRKDGKIWISKGACPFPIRNLIGRAHLLPPTPTATLSNPSTNWKAMADINAVAQQFTDFYYQTFDSNRSNLAPLYVRRIYYHHLMSVNNCWYWSLDSWSLPFPPTSLFPKAWLVYAHLRGYPYPRCGCHHREANSEISSLRVSLQS